MPVIVRTREHKALVDVLVSARLRQRLDQSAVAEESGFSQQQISDIETRRRGIQAAELPALARGYRVPLVRMVKLWEAILKV